ncbi:MAG: complex I subunit 5 family protein, partial [Clostridia bacterium]
MVLKMGGNLKIILPIIIPIIGAIVVFFLNKLHNKTLSRTVFVSFTFITAICCVINCFDTSGEFIMGYIAGEFPIEFKIDELGVYFSLLTSLIWFVVAIYTCRYISHEENENLFLGFYLLVYGILVALDYSANIVTMYLFYELMTVATLTLVLYSRTKEGISAGLKYIAYSLFGAALGLVCILFVVFYGDGIDFREGGVFTNSSVDKDILLIVTFLGIVGFGTKAGIFPLHGWLPIAHPVAPAPASAVLSGILTKSGVLAIIRLVYYIVAADLIRGEWVQYAWIILALTTVLMGSLLAYKEKNLKKRLAYSTVSQVSYILFGLALLEESAFAGAMMHIAFHSVI